MALKIKGDTTKVVKLPTAAPGSGKGFKLRNSTAAGGGGAAAAAYIISGLTQSHWLASNALRSSGSTTVTSIPDESGTESLIAQDPGYYAGSTAAYYDSTGWVSNGKTLPTVRLCGPRLAAHGWGARMSSYTGGFTVAMLINRVNTGAYSQNQLAGFANNSSADSIVLDGGYSSAGRFYSFSGNPLLSVSVTSDQSRANYLGKTCLFFEYGGPSDPSVRGWINGNATNASSSAVWAGATLNRFAIGGAARSNTGVSADFKPVEINMAEFHLYQGVLTSAQRTSVISDMMTRGGL